MKKLLEKQRELDQVTKINTRGTRGLSDELSATANALVELTKSMEFAIRNGGLMENSWRKIPESLKKITTETDKVIEAQRLISESAEEEAKKTETAWSGAFDIVQSLSERTFSTIAAYQQRASEANMNKITSDYEEQSTQIQKLLDLGIISQEEYDARAEQLSRDREKREKEERQRVARQQKELQLFQAIINTAVGVTNALTMGDPYTAGIRAAIVGALGAIEIAYIAAQPIPQFYKGTKDAPGGRALVGEQGYEYVQTPAGELFRTPDRATLIDLPRHSKVFTHSESLQLEKAIGIPRIGLPTDGRGASAENAIVKELSELKKIAAKPAAIVNIDKHGINFMIANGTSYTKYVNNHIRFK